MTWNDRIKKIKRAIARYGLFGSTWFINKLSYKGMRFISHIFMAVGFCFIIKQKRIAYESLRIAFNDEKSEEELKTIFRRCFENVGRGMMELIYYMGHPSLIKEMVYFEGKEHLEEAVKGGKGVIGISAHFGNFPLMLLRCVQEGYTTHAIIRQTRDEEVEKYFQNLRTKLNLSTIYALPRKQCVDESLKALRNNDFLFIPLDQNFGSGRGVFVEFFGQKAATATGPVVLAKRTGAPILPMFIIRQDDDRHKIIIEPPVQLEEKEDDKEYVEVNTAKITKIIENYIRKYPQEWGWMHRRWKSRPAEEEQQPQETVGSTLERENE